MKTELDKATEYLKLRDKCIKKIIDQIGPCKLNQHYDYFKSLVKTIIYQQLSNKVAKSIYKKFELELNSKISPDNILRLSDTEFRRAGISMQKKSYLTDLSFKFINKEIDTNKFVIRNDEEIINTLIKIRGIGRWSAQMFLIFCLNRMDVLPTDDLGLKKSIQVNYRMNKLPSTEEIIEMSKKWEPYRTIAVWYLWQSINTK